MVKKKFLLFSLVIFILIGGSFWLRKKYIGDKVWSFKETPNCIFYYKSTQLPPQREFMEKVEKIAQKHTIFPKKYLIYLFPEFRKKATSFSVVGGKIIGNRAAKISEKQIVKAKKYYQSQKKIPRYRGKNQGVIEEDGKNRSESS